MHKVILFTILVLALACSRDETGYDLFIPKSERMGIDTVASETGFKWRVAIISVGISPWNVDSNRFLPPKIHNNLNLSTQSIHFIKHSDNGGTYETTDTVAQVLRILPKGTFTVEKSENPNMVYMQFVKDTVVTSLIIRKGDIASNLVPNTLRCYTSYVNGTLQYASTIILNR